jgi:exosortase F-associated protein
MPKSNINCLLLGLSALGLVGLRYVADRFLYDPFAQFFQPDLPLPMPEYDVWRLFWSINLRFLGNASLSLLLIYSLFKRSDWLKIALILLLLQHVLCLAAYLYFAHHHFQIGLHPSYYVRRFLLQPLMLLVLLAIFYYQQHADKSKAS